MLFKRVRCATQGKVTLSSTVTPITADPVFDRCWWIYSLCRERLFADHTEVIANALGPLLRSKPHIQLLEVGCGPGFYARGLAARFPGMQVLGVDTSERLLSHARLQAHRAHLSNCRFKRADARTLPDSTEPADAAIASRLFLVVPEPERVVRAIYETLRPGGVFFIAEPTSPLRTSLPMHAMRLFARLTGQPREQSPGRCKVLSHGAFQVLVGGQPWSRVRQWQDRRYQYALCEKGA